MTTTTMFRSGDDEEDAASPSNTFVGTQAASLGPDPHHPVHRPPNGNGRVDSLQTAGRTRRETSEV